MKIIYYLKNIKINKAVAEFIKRKTEKVSKLVKKEPKIDEGIVEVELRKDKEAKEKKGLYKVKIILDLPKKSLMVISSTGRNVFEAINTGFKRLISKIRKERS